MADQAHQNDPERFGFGLTALEVERLRGILERSAGEGISLEQAWGRAAELLSLTHELLELFASEWKEPAAGPGDLTDSTS